MQKRFRLFFFPFFLSLCVISLDGCGKQTYDIGREDPENEIKKCVALSQKKRYEQAVECLEIFKSRFPQTPQGLEAELRIADSYFLQHQYLLSADAYQSFVKFHPTSPQVDYALYRTGMAYLREAPKAIDRDQKYLVKAEEQLELALQVSPQSHYKEPILDELKNVKDRLAARLYYIGHFYYRTGEYLSAGPRFKELVEFFPGSGLVPKTLYLLTKGNIKLNQLENARQAVEMLVQNFPKNRWTKKAEGYYLKVARGKTN